MFSTGENEVPLHKPLRTYTLHAASGANSRDLAVHREGGAAVYTTIVAPVINMHNPNSIALLDHASATVGAARMYDGVDTINLALGDPEDFLQRERCVWEDLHVKGPALLKASAPTTHDFGLGLGDESRRYFQWVMSNGRRPSQPLASSPGDANGHPKHGAVRTHTWSISEHVPGISHSHTFNLSLNSKSEPKRGATVTAVHELHPEHTSCKTFNLVDRDDGEVVAMLLRHEDLRDGELVKDMDPNVKGKFVIFRDFWQPGQFQEEWDKMVLLSGLAVLEKGDRE
jgi:hypothetical protein